MPGEFFSPLFPAWSHCLLFLGEVQVAKQNRRTVLGGAGVAALHKEEKKPPRKHGASEGGLC